MSRRPDRIEEEGREPVRYVIRHREQAALRDGKAFGIASGALPAHELAALAAEMCSAGAALLAAAAEDRDVDDHALAVAPVTGLVDSAGYLVARGDRPAAPPGAEIATAKCAGGHPHQDLAGPRLRIGQLDDLDPALAIELRRSHPFTAPAARPPTSRR